MSVSAEERAKELMLLIFGDARADAATAVTAAIRAAEREVLEDAAKVAERHGYKTGDERSPFRIASRIRELGLNR